MSKCNVFTKLLPIIPIFGLTFVSICINPSAYANQSAPINQQVSNQESPTSQAAIVVSFPTDLTLDIGNKADRPFVLRLEQDYMDSNGNIIALQGSPISAKIKPLEKGIRIDVEGVVTKSQFIPLQASSTLIPADKVTVVSGAAKAKQLSSIGARFGSMALSSIGGGDTEGVIEGGLVGGIAGMVIGLTSPEDKHQVKIPQGSLYVLALQVPSSQPSVPLARQAPKSVPNSKVLPNFNFKNVSQYSAQLKKIVQAYQKGKISKEEARGTIEAANQYATTKLRRKLYPPAVLREQVSQIFTFNYPIDRQEK